MIIQALLFYVLAAVTIGAALMVISVKNPVHAVLSLILAFFSASGLILMTGAEFVAMILIIVYVGAVAVLFLFVVMMLNINFTVLRQGFLRYLPYGAAMALILFVDLFLVLKTSVNMEDILLAPAMTPFSSSSHTSNTHEIGRVLYTDYLYPFQLAGLVLLVAMIGAIVLTLRTRVGVKKQRIHDQVTRTRGESVELVHVKIGAGVDVKRS